MNNIDLIFIYWLCGWLFF